MRCIRRLAVKANFTSVAAGILYGLGGNIVAGMIGSSASTKGKICQAACALLAIGSGVFFTSLLVVVDSMRDHVLGKMGAGKQSGSTSLAIISSDIESLAEDPQNDYRCKITWRMLLALVLALAAIVGLCVMAFTHTQHGDA